MKKSIVIVDDHILIAKALEGIIGNFSEFEVIYVSENGKDLIQKFEEGNAIPDIILLDISMPIMDGFETALWLTKNHPEIKIMALSMQGDDNSVIKMIKSGAKGYLLKNTHPRDLETALTRLNSDGFFYPDWASKIIFSNLNKETETEIAVRISDREKEFLKYTVTELSYKEIADRMCCSPRTVESYRDQLCEKLDLKTRVGLAVFAIKNGFAN
ncbi:DNA-binding NarL/FixJ family response regulator [Chryseobacterium bernardetii]|jgi:DNA-binding NarL/FixJ family response regulator|uniref:LuxR family two component transcriptional regulator n=3 Tax=Chryseobacterium TaxID=59732 RepID=A0A543DV54_9FLAO|nr:MULTISPECIES: response regulator transcription factor [Chryseobacterium]MDR6373101.1 DNA-binding NarL/FixJ family response regulator [Chryseobacterium vietnamense]MDR6443539.1 DNA-binding NarL/FixJ family response regulator [Chryseobacterium bernardetii]MDR6461147.1 DNA-binding NarL/FixJ family response regulator [Chryseobacterium vietnamense]MDR6490019.1 DNA-binding NarL/FixJ family response regulator [Chryseobacterium vietnamense]TQM13201.1 LuxR family two component transcriptional regula